MRGAPKKCSQIAFNLAKRIDFSSRFSSLMTSSIFTGRWYQN